MPRFVRSSRLSSTDFSGTITFHASVVIRERYDELLRVFNAMPMRTFASYNIRYYTIFNVLFMILVVQVQRV